ncbi:MAG: ADOP family duplicated permease [Gemmatimonadales bacterium]
MPRHDLDRGWRRHIRFWAHDVDHDVATELDYHLEMRARDFERRGHPPDEARRFARERFGDVGVVARWLRSHDRKQARANRQRETMSDLMQDIRLALRQFHREPGFAAVAIMTLGLAIAATTSVVSIVNGVLLKPLPFAVPQQLLRVEPSDPSGEPGWISALDYLDLREQGAAFATFTAMQSGLNANLVRGGADADRLAEARVRADFFAVLGVRPQLGRLFVAGDDADGAAGTVVLSDGVWHRLFGGDSSAIGKKVLVNDAIVTVIGVAPAAVQFPDRPEIWVPMTWDSSEISAANRGMRELDVIGRLKPGVGAARARSALAALSLRLAARYPHTNTGYRMSAVPLPEQLVGRVRAPLFAMLGAVALVLLIACANVANLLLARAIARQGEIAVRTALGAGRLRLLRQLLTESMMLALAGAAIGAGIALVTVRGIARFGPADVPRLQDVSLDGRVLAITAAVALMTGLIFGLAPALHAVRTDLAPMLRASGRTGRRERSQRIRSALVVVEVALAVVLLIGAGLLLRSLSRLLQVDPGFRPDHLVAFDVRPQGSRYPYDPDRRSFASELIERLRQLPGTESVAVAAARPFDPQASFDASTSFSITGEPDLPAGEDRTAAIYPVSANYFSTLGIRMIRGRALAASEDRPDVRQAVVVNEALVRKYFPHTDPIGRELVFGMAHHLTAAPADSFRSRGFVVGVVSDVHGSTLAEAPPPAAYLAYNTLPFALSVVMRTRAGLAAAAPGIRAAVRAIDPALPVYSITTLRDALSLSVAQPRFYVALLGSFATLALIIAALGIYGVLAYTVRQRSRELGIRAALGASRGRIAAMVLRHAGVLTATGIALGMGGALLITRTLRSLLFGVTPFDAVALAAAGAVLLGAALVAAWVPTRRAACVDPTVAIRAE